MIGDVRQSLHTGYAMPPFAAIEPAHFKPAFDQALPAHEREIDRIARART